MKARIITFIQWIKTWFIRNLIFFRHPNEFVAKQIYRAYSYRLSKVPFLLFSYVVRYNGGPFSGISVLYDSKRAIFKYKFVRFRNYFFNTFSFSFVLLTLLTYLYFWGVVSYPNWQNLVLNLLSDFIFLLFVFHALPNRLKNEQKTKLKIESTITLSNKKDQVELTITAINVGRKYFAEKEIFWDFFTPDLDFNFVTFYECYLDKEDLKTSSFSKKENYNHYPLFVNERIVLLKLIITKGAFKNGVSTIPLYYSVRTVFESYPTLDNISMDLVEAESQLTFEEMPKYGKIPVIII